MKIIFFTFILSLCSPFAFTQVTEDEINFNSKVDIKKPSPQLLQYYELMNEYRASKGLRTLIPLVSVEKVAYYHSHQMGRRRRPFGHIGWQFRCRWLNNSLKAKSCGEIVAFGQKTPAAVLKAWIDSPEHRESLEHPEWTHTGLGVYKNSSGRLYWTQMFVKLKTSP